MRRNREKFTKRGSSRISTGEIYDHVKLTPLPNCIFWSWYDAFPFEHIYAFVSVNYRLCDETVGMVLSPHGPLFFESAYY